MEFIDLKTQQLRVKIEIDNAIQKVLAHGQYIMGPEVREVEERLADYVGVKHCISAASGTDTLLLALMALGVGPGDEVITTPMTFISTGEMVSLLGATPVFVDIDRESYNLAPDGISAAITDKTKAIMPVSLYGQCADLQRINEVAQLNNIPVIEDGAQSFGALHHGIRSCGLSIIGSTSFFPSKPLGCYGDGGALFTDDDELADKLRLLRTHGQSKRYHHTEIGINGRFDTIQAAILLVKLGLFDEEVELRASIGARYTEQLSGVNGIVTPKIAAENTSVYAQYTIQVPNRDNFIKKMGEKGVPTAIHYPVPLHKQPIYESMDVQTSLDRSEEVADKVVSLPMGPYLTRADQDKVIEAVKSSL